MSVIKKLMAVFIPRTQQAAIEQITEVDVKIAPPPDPGKDYAVKYGFDAAKVARLTQLKGQIPAHLNKAQQLSDSAQAETAAASEKMSEATGILHDFGVGMQKHTAFDIADYEDLGFRRIHVAPDPASATVRITNVVHMPDRIRFEFAKDHWFGLNIYTSDDGVTYKFAAHDNKSPWEDERLNLTNKPEERFYIFRHCDKDGKEIGTELRMTVVSTVYDIEGSRAVPN